MGVVVRSRGFSIGVEGRRVEKNKRFRGRATINGVARLEELLEGIFSRNRPCDKSGSRVRGCLFEKGI